jgi:hypothetical protein
VLRAETSHLHLLHSYDPRMRPTGITLTPLRQGPAVQTLSRIRIGAPPPGDPRKLAEVPDVVPAGRYQLRRRAGGAASGTAVLVIGGGAPAFRVWNLASDFSSGSVQVDLPVNVGSLLIRADDEGAAGHSMALHPTEVWGTGTEPYARRAQRYGPADVYFFDYDAFAEAPGIWIRGGSASTLAAAPGQPGHAVRLFLRNAPVDNRITLAIDGRTQTLVLRPDEERLIALPPVADRRVTVIRIETTAGFRPSEVVSGSTDARLLGVWLEFR